MKEGKLTINNKEERSLIDLLVRYNYWLENKKRADKIFDEKKKEINQKVIKYMEGQNVKSMEVDLRQVKLKSFNGKSETLDGVLTVNHIKTKKVVWSPEEVEDRLPKSLKSGVVKNTITIVNWDEVVELLKKHKVNPKEFIKHLNIEKEVDESALTNLEELGKIDLSDLDGCYNLETKSSYITVSKREVDEWDDID